MRAILLQNTGPLPQAQSQAVRAFPGTTGNYADCVGNGPTPGPAPSDPSCRRVLTEGSWTRPGRTPGEEQWVQHRWVRGNLESVQGKRGRTDVGRTDDRQRCCSHRGETCADQLDVHSGRGDRAFEGRRRAGEGEETQGVGETRNHRHLEEVGPWESHLRSNCPYHSRTPTSRSGGGGAGTASSPGRAELPQQALAILGSGLERPDSCQCSFTSLWAKAEASPRKGSEAPG